MVNDPINMFVIWSCSIKVGVWVRGVNVKWSVASLTCWIWLCFDVCVLAWTDGSWLGHRGSVNRAMNALKSSEQTPDHESSMRKPDLHRSSNTEHKNGECIITPEQNVTFNSASKSWEHLQVSCKLQCQNLHISMENTEWMLINGGQLLLVNLYSNDVLRGVASGRKRVTECIGTLHFVWYPKKRANKGRKSRKQETW